MPKNIIVRRKPLFTANQPTNKRYSWYWNVLLKNCGSEKEAEKAIQKSKILSGNGYDYNYKSGSRIK